MPLPGPPQQLVLDQDLAPAGTAPLDGSPEAFGGPGAAPQGHTATGLEECYVSVIWAMEHGIAEHPEWYPGLTSSSAFEEFQAVLHRGGYGNCPAPCAVGAMPDDHGAGARQPKGSCKTAEYGTPCYERVMWVMRNGIFEHPEWYPTVDILSDFEEVQAALAEKEEAGCVQPCNVSYSGRVGKARVGGICYGLAPHPPDGVPSRWALPKSDQINCYLWLRDRNFVSDADRELDRNWCWVGLKEFGCHRHFYDHLTWAQMQHQAVAVGATKGLDFRPLQGPELCDRPVLGGPKRGGWNYADRDAASAWFEENAVVYVLSLPDSPRRATVSRCMEKRAIPFSGFSDGVDMRQPGALEAAKVEGLVPEEFDFEAAQAEAYSERQGMGTEGSIAGTVGCASGHFRAQRRGAMDERNRSVIVVFEDDVCPERDFVLKLWNVVTGELPCDWQVVSLSSRCPFGRCISPHLTRVQPDVNEPEWRCRHGVNYGFQGVISTGQRGPERAEAVAAGRLRRGTAALPRSRRRAGVDIEQGALLRDTRVPQPGVPARAAAGLGPGGREHPGPGRRRGTGGGPRRERDAVVLLVDVPEGR
ncbi:unnamed protein product [Prorocentrum cordatum]|uniref:Alpha-1,6-mannosyl-glycoprotein 6-beta-N-acetylglucosaminyltransferase n=1 Tax=Prorocentrum cordatum TaxID=2364126 RepID=A0ABN9SXH3_9DINO|nr:unnamed protein product [Polarella glacialis]